MIPSEETRDCGNIEQRVAKLTAGGWEVYGFLKMDLTIRDAAKRESSTHDCLRYHPRQTEIGRQHDLATDFLVLPQLI